MRRAATLASSPDRTDRSPVPFSRRPLRFAHRGASSRAPENTLAAFEEAIGLGVDAIELDVHLSADGIPVVIHDEWVDRTTDGHGLVSALTFGALRGLDAGAWFDRRFRGERIPSLDEALDLTRERCGLNIEIKAEQPAPAFQVGEVDARGLKHGDLAVVQVEDVLAVFQQGSGIRSQHILVLAGDYGQRRAAAVQSPPC